jgi:HSP20 family molecular chaperone IbpA
MSGLREFGESAAMSVLERVGRGVSRVQERKPLPYDLLESEDAYLLVFDAPGVQRSDVQVRFLEGEVQVRIDRFRDFHEGFEMRFPGRGLSLDGSAELPDDASVNADEATATLTESGTLRVRIPKDERAQNVTVTDESDDEASLGDDAVGEGDDADPDEENYDADELGTDTGPVDEDDENAA